LAVIAALAVAGLPESGLLTVARLPPIAGLLAVTGLMAVARLLAVTELISVTGLAVTSSAVTRVVTIVRLARRTIRPS
jgi:hypothetical protein